MKKLPLLAALAATSLAPAAASAAAKPLTIKVLSGRPDLVSANDALVAIGGTSATKGLKVTVNGKNRTRAFATVDSSVEALLTGLKLGKNTVIARAGKRATQLVITNHPQGGPVFSGPQLQPWVCQETAKDKQCN